MMPLPATLVRSCLYAACAGSMLFSGGAYALDAALGSGSGTIEFTGEITGATCEIDVGGSGVLKAGKGSATKLTIPLDTIGVNSFEEMGSTAGRKNFDIKLINCGETNSKAKLSFEGPLVTTSTAQGVEFVLYGANAELDVKRGGKILAVAQLTDGGGAFSLAVAYRKTGEIAPGTLSASTAFTLSYE